MNLGEHIFRGHFWQFSRCTKHSDAFQAKHRPEGLLIFTSDILTISMTLKGRMFAHKGGNVERAIEHDFCISGCELESDHAGSGI